jgi:tetratricopeptide (TPR) repeat protein
MNNNRRTHTLLNLITDFEALMERGEVGFFDRKEFLKLIDYYQEEQLIDKAIEVVDFALEQYNYINEFYLVKSRLLLKKNSPKLAIHYIEHAEKISPYESEVRILKAKALSMIGEAEEARLILSELMGIGEQAHAAEIGLTESYIFEAEGNYEKMYLRLKEVLFLDPENEEALEKINYASALARRFEENIDFHNELLDLNPYNYLAWYNIGQSYSNIGEYEEAIDAMEYSFLIKNDFESGYLDCADMCIQINRFDQAAEIFKDYLKAFDKDPFVLVNLVLCQLELDQVEEAKEHALDAVRLDPYNDEAFYLLAEIYKREEQWERALNAYFKAIEIEDNREEYYFGLGKMYQKLKETAKAEHYFDEMLSLEPSEEYFYEEYLKFLVSNQKYTKGLKVIKQSEENVYSTDILYLKIICLLGINKRSRAIALLDLVLEENYEKHSILCEFMPEILQDEAIQSIIRYYQK